MFTPSVDVIMLLYKRKKQHVSSFDDSKHLKNDAIARQRKLRLACFCF